MQVKNAAEFEDLRESNELRRTIRVIWVCLRGLEVDFALLHPMAAVGDEHHLRWTLHQAIPHEKVLNATRHIDSSAWIF